MWAQNSADLQRDGMSLKKNGASAPEDLQSRAGPADDSTAPDQRGDAATVAFHQGLLSI
jgi:hypothetical protein